MQTDTGIVVTSQRHCRLQRPPAARLQKLFPRRLFTSFVAFNKAYSTGVNKRVHCVRTGQFTTGPRHTRDDCKLGGWGATLSVLHRALMKAIAVTGQIAGFTCHMGPGYPSSQVLTSLFCIHCIRFILCALMSILYFLIHLSSLHVGLEEWEY